MARKLVAKEINPRDTREVLVSLTKAGLSAHDRIVEGAMERQRDLLAGIDPALAQPLLAAIDVLTEKAAAMLEAERQVENK
ncbi:hypothetical protein [Bradyrhizobium sp. 2TAF24]|uniref:hypothetical protein n=1 Tax=Bradyrhizobium sp. 2TAF24 TaxID=3233011 RepID=UPI003F8FE10E